MSGSNAVSKRPGAKTRMPSTKLKSHPDGSAKQMTSFGKASSKLKNRPASSRNPS